MDCTYCYWTGLRHDLDNNGYHNGLISHDVNCHLETMNVLTSYSLTFPTFETFRKNKYQVLLFDITWDYR
jgi:hypothetical protein